MQTSSRGWGRALCCLALVVGLCVTAASVAAGERRVAVELTWLQAAPGERAALTRFIRLNWLAMDAIATRQGLMRDYRLLENAGEGESWDVLVIVSYHDERGYAGIASAFEAIRARHQTVLVDGKDLSTLGKIVRSERSYEDATAPD